MTKLISQADLSQLAESAQQADRRRNNLNVHDSVDANVQRLFIATQPETYIRPHRHSEPHKWEFFMVIQGSMSLLLFSDDGRIEDRIELSALDVRAVEIPPNTWHSYTCMEEDTVALEIKEGAYTPTPEQDLAPWSPKENTPDTAAYVEWMKTAKPGDKFN
ncbi:WbuC family cupin fold metalloprotein [Microbulbifer hainanensis]|uniref:WbuC family cupin fold metalloprotein n=1 Tax=Microbulbifer hainanensis TaxID=2735675 RepID=UPI001865AECB|nr:WbuC family cupin fold metalloprotein [Microbulbifer hainanensis]